MHYLQNALFAPSIYITHTKTNKQKNIVMNNIQKKESSHVYTIILFG